MKYEIHLVGHFNIEETVLVLELDYERYHRILSQHEPTAVLHKGVYWYLVKPFEWDIKDDVTIMYYEVEAMAVFNDKVEHI